MLILKLLKSIAIYFVAFNIVGSSLMVPLIHLDFELRRDYIAKVLCINRTKPITVCGGQCYLDKKLKKAAHEQEKEPISSNRVLEISFFNQKIADLAFDYSIAEQDFIYPVFDSENHTSSFVEGIFRPPQHG